MVEPPLAVYMLGAHLGALGGGEVVRLLVVVGAEETGHLTEVPAADVQGARVVLQVTLHGETLLVDHLEERVLQADLGLGPLGGQGGRLAVNGHLGRHNKEHGT